MTRAQFPLNPRGLHCLGLLGLGSSPQRVKGLNGGASPRQGPAFIAVQLFEPRSTEDLQRCLLGADRCRGLKG